MQQNIHTVCFALFCYGYIIRSNNLDMENYLLHNSDKILESKNKICVHYSWDIQ